jgi:hypothetical protein
VKRAYGKDEIKPIDLSNAIDGTCSNSDEDDEDT